MNSKNVLKIFIPLVFSVLLANCSNNNQPVSVDSNTIDFTAIANSSLKIQDMGRGGSQLWAVTKNPVSTSDDFYLAKWNTLTAQWDMTGHYGIRCAVSETGKCYHVNSFGHIWWVTLIGYNQNGVPQYQNQYLSLPNQNWKAIDIGASIIDGAVDNLWVIFDGNDGNVYTCYGTYYGSGSYVNWSNPTPHIPTGDPVRISADPAQSSAAVVVSNIGQVFLIDPDPSKPEGITFKDAAMMNSCYYVGIKDSKLWYGQYKLHYTPITAVHSVSMAKINNMMYVYWIDSEEHLAFDSYEHIHSMYPY